MTIAILSGARRATRAALVAGLGALLGACAPGDATSPDGARDANGARLSLEARVSATSAGLGLRLRPEYQRTDGSFAPLDTGRTVAIDDGAAQRFPLVLDLAPCLSDRSRRVEGLGCAVRLTVELVLLPDAVLDRQVIGPLGMAPGRITTIPGISLFEIASVRVALSGAAPPAPGVPVRAEVGAPLTLVATPVDQSGRAVTGRSVTWTSSAPTIASVDPVTGVVTPRLPGTATISASTGPRTGAVVLNVVPPPSVASIAAASLSGTGGGTITSSPAGLACTLPSASGSCAAPFPADVAITLTAAPDSQSTFVSWGGACAGTTSTVCTIPPGQPRATSATFERRRVTLTLALAGAGGGTLLVDGAAACTLAEGAGSATCAPRAVDAFARVRLTVTTAPGSRVLAWSGACAGTTGSECIVASGSAASVGVTLERDVRTVEVAPSGVGGGRITSAPAGIDCTVRAGVRSGTCTAPFPTASAVSLSLVPDSATAAGLWGGACTGPATAPCALTGAAGSGAQLVTVTLPRRQVALTLALSGSGGGTLAANGVVLCTLAAGAGQAACAAQLVDAYSTVTLTAAPDASSLFAGWSGACAGTTGTTCTLVPATPLAAGASLAARAPITLALSGAGDGRVVSIPAGIDCVRQGGATSGTCAAVFPPAAQVRLVATAGAASVLGGWAGACAGTDGDTCLLTAPSGANDGVQASLAFDPVTYTLTVASDPAFSVQGLVRSGDGQIECTIAGGQASGACQGTYAAGASVTLTASPAADFVAWSGACAGTSGPVCTVSMTGARTAIARFAFPGLTPTATRAAPRTSAGRSGGP